MLSLDNTDINIDVPVDLNGKSVPLVEKLNNELVTVESNMQIASL